MPAPLSSKRLHHSAPTGNDHAAIANAQSPLKCRPWNVVHACEWARELLPLLEGQLAVGMRPSLLTPVGFGLASNLVETNRRTELPQISLLQMWSHVREWRRLLNESAAETSGEVVHAHSFASGMAAVRGDSGVVYQLKESVDKLAIASGNYAQNSWLIRSFRVAEQFVLTRAAAVVVDRHSQRLACMERGVGAGSIFLIPEPVATHVLESTPERTWLEAIAGGRSDTVFFLIPGLPTDELWEERDALLRWMRLVSVLRAEHTNVKFIFFARESTAEHIRTVASACNLAEKICVLSQELREQTMASADVIICDREHASGGFALEALARGRTLLAADIEEHREITSDGRGCLWYRAGEVGDIAQRASFLAENAQFRRALGSAAREHCLATRSAEVIGAQYDAVYRVAYSKRKNRDNSTPKTQLIPLQVGS